MTDLSSEGQSRRAFVGGVLAASGLFSGCLQSQAVSDEETPSDKKSVIELHNSDSWEGWEQWGGEKSIDEQESLTGNSSLRVEADQSADRAAVRYRFASRQDFSQRFPVFGLKWKPAPQDAADTGGRSCGLRLVDDEDRVATFYQSFYRTFILGGKWQRVAPSFRQDRSDSDFDFQNVVKIEFYHYTGGEYSATFWIDDLRLPRSDRDRGAVMIHFDDSSSTVYDTAYPIMKRHGIPGTFNVITERIGGKNSPSVHNLREMSDNGWTIAAHPQYYDQLTDVSDRELREKMEQEVNFLSENGFAPSIIAWPYNQWDARSIKIAEDYFDVGFSGGSGPHIHPPASGTELIYPRIAGNNIELHRNAIDHVAERNGLACPLFHIIGESISEREFADFAEYVASKPVDVVTASDLLDTQ